MPKENNMKAKNIAAMVMAGVMLAGSAFPALAAQETVSELSSVVRQGSFIRSLTTDRSMYSPKETVTASAKISGTGTAEAAMTLRYLDKEVWTKKQEIDLGTGTWSFSFQAPDRDFTGYSLEMRLYRDGTLLDYTMTGVDVSSDWNVFPRYGYVTKMDYGTEEVEESLDRLKNHHINGLFYYDVFDSQEKPLAGSPEQPAESWETLNRSTAKKQTLLDTINIGHKLNMKSFFYNLIFGVYDGYEQAGAKKEWGMYCDPFHQEQDGHHIGDIGWETKTFWLMNPANKEWQDFYIAAHKDLFSVYPYDGMQVDSLGSRGDRYDYEGNPIQLDNAYVPMLNRLSAELDKKVIFNPVSAYGLNQQLMGTDYDIVYMEIWPAEVKDYASLKKVVDDIYKFTGGRKGTVIAAYMNYDASKAENFNTPSINYINTMLMASGASHLELGDTGMLSSEYYPGKSMRISSALAEDVRNEYDFLVAYENLLRGTGLGEVNDKTVIGAENTSKEFKPGSVSSFTKVKHTDGEPDREILHLINMDGAVHDSWVDKGLAQQAPVIKKDQTVTHTCTFVPTKVWVASPDYNGGMMQEVPFTVRGNKVTFTLPYLEYYTMVVME